MERPFLTIRAYREENQDEPRSLCAEERQSEWSWRDLYNIEISSKLFPQLKEAICATNPRDEVEEGDDFTVIGYEVSNAGDYSLAAADSKCSTGGG